MRKANAQRKVVQSVSKATTWRITNAKSAILSAVLSVLLKLSALNAKVIFFKSSQMDLANATSRMESSLICHLIDQAHASALKDTG